MNTKIPVKKLSEKVAVSVNMPVEEVQSFIKILFEQIVDGLQQGESVTLPGLGKFTASSMPDEPVAFIPEREFADAVNAPFVMFEPIPLNEGVTEEILDSVSISDASERRQSTIATEEPIPSPLPEEKPEISNVEIEESPVSEQSPETGEDIPILTDTETHIDTADATMTEVCNNDDDDDDESDTVSEIKESISGADIVTSQNYTDIAIEDRRISDVQAAIPQDHADDPSLYIPEDEVEYVGTSDDKDRSRFLPGFILGLITGLAIGALALFAYMVYFINSPVTPVE